MFNCWHKCIIKHTVTQTSTADISRRMGCTGELSNFPLGIFTGRHLANKSLRHFSSPLYQQTASEVKIWEQVQLWSGQSHKLTERDIITRHRYPTCMAANPTSHVSTSNGKPHQKSRGYYSNKGPTNFMLKPLVSEWDARQAGLHSLLAI